MTRYQIKPENKASEELIPPNKPDRSGIGVNYADEYLKNLNLKLENKERLVCKRRGLKISVKIGKKRKGEAIMRRAEHGPDVKVILNKAICTAMEQAGAKFLVEDGIMYLEMDE